MKHYEADTVNVQSVKPLLQEKLKNEDTLYCLYSGYDTKIPQEILNNKEFLQEMYRDPDFMRASNLALLRVVQDRLKNDKLSKKRAEAVSIIATFFLKYKKLYFVLKKTIFMQA